jgi:putative serine protease PepD
MGPRRAALVGGVAGALVALLVVLLVSVFTGDGGDDPDAAGASSTTLPRSADSAGSPDIEAILAKVQRSVVALETSTTTGRGVFSGAGSGIVISEDGLILTNAHVVGSSDGITVVLWDGTRRSATLVGSSPQDDLALVQVQDPSGLVPAELGSSADLAVGDPVVAIGNALNLGGPPSVTLGIVSAKDREIEAPGVTLSGLIQTDAAINPGNSGGPLVDADGRVVGVNTAIIEDSQNIGFAIAIDTAQPIIEQLRSGEGVITPNTAYLGVSTVDVGTLAVELRDMYGVTVAEGAMVSDVVPDQGAANAGLTVGDVIVAIDGEAVSSSGDVGAAIRAHEPGDRVVLDVERAGARFRVPVELGRRG